MRITTSTPTVVIIILLGIAASGILLFATSHSPSGPLTGKSTESEASAPSATISPTPVTPLPAPTIGPIVASPLVIPVNTPTLVTVTAQITDPSLIPTGINLLRINPTGNPTIIAQLVDNGTNADAVAGDKLFSTMITFIEPYPGIIKLQVSAAFRGVLKRVLSNPVVIAVENVVSVERKLENDLRAILSPFDITVATTLPDSPQGSLQLVVEWDTAVSPNVFTEVGRRSYQEPPPPQRTLDLKSPGIFAVALNAQAQLKAWDSLGDPRQVSIETPPDAVHSAVRTSRFVDTPHFAITLRADSTITEIRFFTTQWTGSAHAVTYIGHLFLR